MCVSVLGFDDVEAAEAVGRVGLRHTACQLMPSVELGSEPDSAGRHNLQGLSDSGVFGDCYRPRTRCINPWGNWLHHSMLRGLHA